MAPGRSDIRVGFVAFRKHQPEQRHHAERKAGEDDENPLPAELVVT